MAESLTTLDLVKWYFNICNTALATRDANPVVEAVESLVARAVSGQVITLKVVDDSQAPAGYYTTRFIDGRFTPVEEGEENPDSRFTLSRSFLQEVVDNSDRYVEHPDRLDWSWLTPG